MELIGIEDIMKLLNIGRAAATQLCNMPGCPVLPRIKNAPYRVIKEPFLDWVKGGCKRK